jgi:glucose-1-phosphate cytidylyltransferase
MKVVILAGGFGTRLAEETHLKPKPMVEVGDRPILWHIMKHYAHFGFDEFVIALGYKGDQIKRYFLDYNILSNDLTVDLRNGEVRVQSRERDEWVVELVDTGLNTMTGGRIKRLAERLGNETFMLTYGDGVSDVDLDALLDFHRSHGRLATLTAVRPSARFGRLDLEGDSIAEFSEKPKLGEGWINGGFFVLEPGVIDYIDADDTSWEREPLERIARDGQLMAFRHDSFWQCMDTVRDRTSLESLWQSGEAPWQVWRFPHEGLADRSQRIHRNGNGAVPAGSGT